MARTEHSSAHRTRRSDSDSARSGSGAARGAAHDAHGSGTATDASVLLPARMTLANLRRAAATCTACDLYRCATQTVFGEGVQAAEVVLVGEQPGDQEDRQGKPFVGPAGRVLDDALEQAGILREAVYVTNAVKHFKWEPKGKRRIHKKPNLEEIRACRPWLDAELAVVRPQVVVCLGATAAQALLGPSFRLTQHRGEFFRPPGLPMVTATVHPSSVLRQRSRDERHAAMHELVLDLQHVAGKLAELGANRALASTS